MKHNFEYLRPPKEVLKIKHKPEYIHSGSGKSAHRRIYLNTDYDKFEKEKIEELRTVAEVNGIVFPSNWAASQSLRFLYSSSFEFAGKSGAISLIQDHLQFLSNPDFQDLSSEGEKILEKGLVYQYGRDHMYRPLIIINASKIDPNKVSAMSFLNALVTLLETVKKYKFVPGVVESWVVIIDCTDVVILDFMKVLKKGIDTLSLNYPEYLEHLFIYNPPGALLMSWKIISSLISPNTLKKIVFIEPQDASILHKVIPSDQLEQKFGGILANLSSRFWPPQKTFGVLADSDFEIHGSDGSFYQDFGFNYQDNSMQKNRPSPRPSAFNPQNALSIDSKLEERDSRIKLMPFGSPDESRITNEIVEESDDLSRELENFQLARNSLKKGSTQPLGVHSRKTGLFVQIDEETTTYTISPKTMKSIKSPTYRAFKEDAMYRSGNSNRSSISEKNSMDYSTKKKTLLDFKRFLVENNQNEKSMSKIINTSRLSLGKDASGKGDWSQRVIQDPPENQTKQEDKGWFCGFCTTRKTKKEKENK